MKLTQLKIKNFKCFKEEQTLDFSKLTILTGANSSGKSSILYSILGSTQSGEFPFHFSTNGKYVNMGDFKEISHNHKKNNEITIGFTFQNGITQKISTTWIEDKKNNLPLLKSLEAESDYFKLSINKSKKYSLSFDYIPEKDPSFSYMNADVMRKFIGSIHTFIDETEPTISLTKKKTPPRSLKELAAKLTESTKVENLEFTEFDELRKYTVKNGDFRLEQIIRSLSKIFKDYDEKLNFISSFRLHPERTYLEKTKAELKVEKFGEGYLDQIILWETKKSKKFKELLEIMEGLSLLTDIKTNRLEGGRFEILVKANNNGILTSLSDVGFGISQFLPIIVADLQLPNDSTLFVAQPEIHLHPSVQSLFGDYIAGQINKTKKNYVVESHSEYFLNRIRLAIVKGELKESDISVLYIDNKNNSANIHKIQFTKSGQIVNAPEDFFKTYMMDVMEIALNAEE